MHINFEGFNSVEGVELRVGRTSIIASDLAMDEESIVDINECFDENHMVFIQLEYISLTDLLSR